MGNPTAMPKSPTLEAKLDNVSSWKDVKSDLDMKHVRDAFEGVMGYQTAHVELNSEVPAEAINMKTRIRSR
jgi:hypothetical protein